MNWCCLKQTSIIHFKLYCIVPFDDAISVDRPLHSRTVVSIVMTFGIKNGRTDVNSRAGSSFAMMISHGQRCSCKGR